ncbi:MAG: hypothetical protein ACRD15_02195 [Vicinamibacterales bacterium]
MPRGRPGKRNKDVLLKSAELLGWALGGLEREIAQTRERLASLTAEANKLRSRLGVSGGRNTRAASSGDTATVSGRKRKRRKMSAEARKRISEMMTKRWAERRKRKTT